VQKSRYLSSHGSHTQIGRHNFQCFVAFQETASTPAASTKYLFPAFLLQEHQVESEHLAPEMHTGD
jgi:hypothetical protein